MMHEGSSVQRTTAEHQEELVSLRPHSGDEDMTALLATLSLLESPILR